MAATAMMAGLCRKLKLSLPDTVDLGDVFDAMYSTLNRRGKRPSQCGTIRANSYSKLYTELK